jgi:hypothetical protein
MKGERKQARFTHLRNSIRCRSGTTIVSCDPWRRSRSRCHTTFRCFLSAISHGFRTWSNFAHGFAIEANMSAWSRAYSKSHRHTTYGCLHSAISHDFRMGTRSAHGFAPKVNFSSLPSPAIIHTNDGGRTCYAPKSCVRLALRPKSQQHQASVDERRPGLTRHKAFPFIAFGLSASIFFQYLSF